MNNKIRLTYNIGVHNELVELTELLEFLLPRIDEEDEVLIQCDSDSVTKEVSQFVKIQEKLDKRIKVIEFPLNNDFASFKNNMIKYAGGDFCFNLDPDEKPSEYLLYYVKQVIENNNVDVFFIPRINTVDGLTSAHIHKWGWRITRIESENLIGECIMDTDSDEYKFLKQHGLIIEESEIDENNL